MPRPGRLGSRHHAAPYERPADRPGASRASTASLSAGRNSIRLEATTSGGLANIDSLAVTGGNGVQGAVCGGGTDGTDGDFYVAPGGNDSNPGTIDRPLASLQRAIDVAEPGDLVYVRGGVYNITDPAIPSAGVNFWI